MPYVNIDQSKLLEATGKLVGKLLAEARSKIQKEIQNIKVKVRNTIGSFAADIRANGLKYASVLIAPKIQSIIRSIEPPIIQVQSQLKVLRSTLDSIRKVPTNLTPLLKVLDTSLKIVLNLPIPQAVPPGVGLPISVTTKYADLMHLLKETVKMTKDDIEGIEHITTVADRMLGEIEQELREVMSIIQVLKVEEAITVAINENKVTVKQLQDIGLVDSDENTLFSKLVGQLSGPVTTLGQVQSIEGLITSSGIEGDSVPLSSRLKGQELLSEIKGNVVLDKILAGYERQGIPETIRESIRVLLETLITKESKNTTPQLDSTYTTKQGEVFTIEVVEELGKGFLNKYYAVAKNREGIIMLQGNKTFSTDKQLLVDEIKFRLDQLT